MAHWIDELNNALPSLQEIDAELARRGVTSTPTMKALSTFTDRDLCKELSRRSNAKWGEGRGFHENTVAWAFAPRRPAPYPGYDYP